jgi:hypothetical protein
MSGIISECFIKEKVVLINSPDKFKNVTGWYIQEEEEEEEVEGMDDENE